MGFSNCLRRERVSKPTPSSYEVQFWPANTYTIQCLQNGTAIGRGGGGGGRSLSGKKTAEEEQVRGFIQKLLFRTAYVHSAGGGTAFCRESWPQGGRNEEEKGGRDGDLFYLSVPSKLRVLLLGKACINFRKTCSKNILGPPLEFHVFAFFFLSLVRKRYDRCTNLSETGFHGR